MGGLGKCCCCKLKLADLPNWQIDGYEVTTDWNNERSGVKSCCWEREYTAIGNHNAGLITSADLTRFWINELTRTDAKALSVPVGWIWKGLNSPSGLPPGPLCKEEAGLIGYSTCDYTEEFKRRAYLYYQPWKIKLVLSQYKDRCDTEEPIRKIFTLSVQTELRYYGGVQTFLRQCTRRNYYVTHDCFERNSVPSIESGCESTNLDYATLTPASDFVAWEFGTKRTVTLYQFETIPDLITVNSHVSEISEETWEECIQGVPNCHAFGPGAIDGDICFVWNSFNVEPIPDSTPYVQIQSFSQEECAAYGDCTAPTYGYDLPTKVLCTDTGTTAFRINTAGPPLCTQTWNELRPQTTSVPEGGATTPFCLIQGGDPRAPQIWYQAIGICCSDAIPCPDDGDYDGGPVATDINGDPILPPGYLEGWYGGVYCISPGKWSVVSYEVETEYLPTTERELCIPAIDFVLEVPE